jgi:hypothetical protein
METIDILQLAKEIEGASDAHNQPRALKSALSQQSTRSSLQIGLSVTGAPVFNQVHISSPVGFSAHGLLKSISRGGVLVITPSPVPTRCPLQVGIVGCRLIGGEALYSTRRATVHRVGIVFSSRHKPNIDVGSPAKIRSLEPPFAAGLGSIVRVGSSSLSIFSKATIVPGSWIRIESSGWILFGVVKDRVPTSMVGRCLEIQLEAAFPADSTSSAAVRETISASPRPEPPTRTDVIEHAAEGRS